MKGRGTAWLKARFGTAWLIVWTVVSLAGVVAVWLTVGRLH
jgi:hypothetical protein